VQKSNETDELSFVNKITDLQRKAAAHQLKPTELENATIGFSSMSRWTVERHVPILSPQTALMIAHTVNARGEGILGASYDHRVLNGGDVVKVLKKLSKPKQNKQHNNG
jgi:pyruvate/2-oxoglutarate dehydrogenase complex dihydrolipoamide acyltransferase (E2) component